MKVKFSKSSLAVVALASVVFCMGTFTSNIGFKDDSLFMEDVLALGNNGEYMPYTQVFKLWHETYFIVTDTAEIPTDSTYGKTSAKIGRDNKQLDNLRKAGYKWDHSHIHEACICKYNETVDDEHKIPLQ